MLTTNSWAPSATMPSWKRSLCYGLLHLLGSCSGGKAALDLGFADDTDLTKFVTRPEIKAPVFNVTYRAEQGVSPGLWFVGVYAKVFQEEHPRKYYQPCSTGPAIYDNDGELVWSGACLFKNSNACDFRSFVDANGDNYLSLILKGYLDDLTQKAVIMDSSYSLENARNTTALTLDYDFNMHEWKVIDQGRRALRITYKPEYIVLDGIETERDVGWVSNVGFREIDLQTGETVFEWFCLDNGQVYVWETNIPVEEDVLEGPYPLGWNWFHPNSVDKSAEGDYLISGRFVDTIYKVSGKYGVVLWRLGGRFSDFELVGFNFSKQHDAQFVGRDPATGVEIISFFDNAKAVHTNGIETAQTGNVSALLIVALDTRDMTARVLSRIERPDGGITALRGNYQRLANGNAVGAWSENAYVSEHAPDGRVVFEGRFASQRFVTYRMYKHNFTAVPSEPPTLKAFVYGDSPAAACTTAWYVSWNGATEVAEWRFSRGEYGGEGLGLGLGLGQGPPDGSVGDGDQTPASFARRAAGAAGSVVATVKKSGFETMHQSDGAEGMVYVEALAKNGSVIGRSPNVMAVLPYEWDEEAGGEDREQQQQQQQHQHQPPSSESRIPHFKSEL